jgi:hypothetical protein
VGASVICTGTRVVDSAQEALAGHQLHQRPGFSSAGRWSVMTSVIEATAEHTRSADAYSFSGVTSGSVHSPDDKENTTERKGATPKRKVATRA